MPHGLGQHDLNIKVTVLVELTLVSCVLLLQKQFCIILGNLLAGVITEVIIKSDLTVLLISYDKKFHFHFH